MRYCKISDLPKIASRKRLDFQKLLAALRRDKWCEITHQEFKNLTGSKAKTFTSGSQLPVKQKTVVRYRTVGNERMMFARLY